mmetsp:Transcript_8199/g.23413  ORF Transcript_8199/g.23413 Transcript_8199/m.23413 type:complete len:920 (-) Transcript_8199:144-2903(-)
MLGSLGVCFSGGAAQRSPTGSSPRGSLHENEIVSPIRFDVASPKGSPRSSPVMLQALSRPNLDDAVRNARASLSRTVSEPAIGLHMGAMGGSMNLPPTAVQPGWPAPPSGTATPMAPLTPRRTVQVRSMAIGGTAHAQLPTRPGTPLGSAPAFPQVPLSQASLAHVPSCPSLLTRPLTPRGPHAGPPQRPLTPGREPPARPGMFVAMPRSMTPQPTSGLVRCDTAPTMRPLTPGRAQPLPLSMPAAFNPPAPLSARAGAMTAPALMPLTPGQGPPTLTPRSLVQGQVPLSGRTEPTPAPRLYTPGRGAPSAGPPMAYSEARSGAATPTPAAWPQQRAAPTLTGKLAARPGGAVTPTARPGGAVTPRSGAATPVLPLAHSHSMPFVQAGSARSKGFMDAASTISTMASSGRRDAPSQQQASTSVDGGREPRQRVLVRGLSAMGRVCPASRPEGFGATRFEGDGLSSQGSTLTVAATVARPSSQPALVRMRPPESTARLDRTRQELSESMGALSAMEALLQATVKTSRTPRKSPPTQTQPVRKSWPSVDPAMALPTKAETSVPEHSPSKRAGEDSRTLGLMTDETLPLTCLINDLVNELLSKPPPTLVATGLGPSALKRCLASLFDAAMFSPPATGAMTAVLGAPRPGASGRPQGRPDPELVGQRTLLAVAFHSRAAAAAFTQATERVCRRLGFSADMAVAISQQLDNALKNALDLPKKDETSDDLASTVSSPQGVDERSDCDVGSACGGTAVATAPEVAATPECEGRLLGRAAGYGTQGRFSMPIGASGYGLDEGHGFDFAQRDPFARVVIDGRDLLCSSVASGRLFDGGRNGRCQDRQDHDGQSCAAVARSSAAADYSSASKRISKVPEEAPRQSQAAVRRTGSASRLIAGTSVLGALGGRRAMNPASRRTPSPGRKWM